MNSELKAYLDAWEARRQREFEEFVLASVGLDEPLATVPIVVELATTAGDFTEPVTASSVTTEFVLASAGLAEPPVPAPSIVASPVAAPAAPIDTIAMAPVTCSTECPSCDDAEPAHTYTPAAAPTSPTAIVDVIPMLAAAAAGDGTLDGEPIDVIDMQPRFGKALDISKLDYTVSHETANVEVLTMVDIISYDPGEDRRPPWPPPSLNLASRFDGSSDGNFSKKGSTYGAILIGQAAVFLGLSSNTVFAQDDPVAPAATSEQTDAKATCLRRIEDGSVISNEHTIKWRICTDSARDYFLEGKLDEAEKLFKAALQVAKEGFGLRDPHVASALNNLAEFYRLRKEYEKAEPLYMETIEILEQSFGPDDMQVGTVFRNLGQYYRIQRRFDQAQTCYERALKIEGRVMGLSHPDYANTMYRLAKVLSQQRKGNDAETLTRESIRILEEAGLGESPACIQRMMFLSLELVKSKRLVEAEILQRKILHNLELSKGWDSLDGEANQHRKNQRWITPLHYYAHLQWSSLQLVGAFRIWLVAWTMDGLEFSMGHGQAPFQGGRNVIRVAFSDHVQVSHDYYIAFINQIPIGYVYYLDQPYYFNTVRNDIIYYQEDYHGDSSMTKEVHMPWDPGKLVLRYHPKLRLGDKPNFKEGGMLGTYSTATWAGLLGCHMGQVQG